MNIQRIGRWLSGALLGGLFALSLAACGGPGGEISGDFEISIGVSTGEQDPRNIAAQQFADEVAEKTEGRITAKIHANGELGGDADMIDAMAVKSSKVDIVITDASNFATYEPKMGISAQPFLFSDFDTAWEFMDGEIEAEAEQELIKENMRVLAHYDNGFRCVTNSAQPVNSPEDMRGLIIRTPENPVIMATMSALGASPQPLSFAELYPALRAGTYDGQENPIPVIYNNNLYEVQPYLAVTNHIYSGMCFTISEELWNRFSRADQKIIEEAALHSAEADRKMNREQTESLLSELVDAGVQVTTPDLTPFAEATESVLSGNASTYGELYDKLVAWLSEKEEK